MKELSLVQVLAQRSVISRRQAAQLIRENRIAVNGTICSSISAEVDDSARITLDGRALEQEEIYTRVLLYHKQVGELCSQAKEKNKPTVFENLPRPEAGKWIMVGRLDINTSGLLLFTTDGELAYRLMHPKYKLDREYIARVRGNVTEDTLERLKQGVPLDGKISKFNDIIPKHRLGKSKNQYFHLVVQEGRNRMVRRLWEKFDFQVSRLARIRFANITLPETLNPGEHILLNKTDRRRLAACVSL